MYLSSLSTTSLGVRLMSEKSACKERQEAPGLPQCAGVTTHWGVTQRKWYWQNQRLETMKQMSLPHH